MLPAPSPARRWLVLTMSFFNILVTGSVNYNVGVLNMALTDYFDPDPLMTSWLMSLYIALFALVGPVASVVIDVFSCQTCVFLSGFLTLAGFVLSAFVSDPAWLFLTFTILGTGQALSVIGGSMILSFYFSDIISIANGICICGAGLGIFIHPPLLQLLVDEYGLRGAFLLLGAISFNACVAAMFFRPNEAEVNKKIKLRGEKKHTGACDQVTQRFSILQIPAFSLFLLANLFCSLGYTVAIVYLPDYLVTAIEFSKSSAASAVSLIGIGSMVSRLLAGFAASDPNVGEMLVYMGVQAVAGAITLCGPVLLGLAWGPYIFTFALGLYTGGHVTLMAPITIKLLGLDRASVGLGVVYMVYGIGCILGPPAAVKVVQVIGYDALFYLGGVSFLLSFTCCLLTTLTNQRGHLTANDDMKDLKIKRTQSLMGSLFYSSEYIFPVQNHEFIIANTDKLSMFSGNDDLLNKLSMCDFSDFDDDEDGVQNVNQSKQSVYMCEDGTQSDMSVCDDDIQRKLNNNEEEINYSDDTNPSKFNNDESKSRHFDADLQRKLHGKLNGFEDGASNHLPDAVIGILVDNIPDTLLADLTSRTVLEVKYSH